MTISKARKYYLLITALFVLGVSNSIAQVDSTYNLPQFDSQLLRLKVPEAFQRSSLKLEVYADSSWQLYRGSEALNFNQAMHLLDQPEKIVQLENHLKQEAEYLKDYRSRRVFALITALGGVSYLTFIWDKGWVYQIPGYVAITVAGIRLRESRKLEIQALREQYFIRSLINPSHIELLVEEYNFRLYQYLSTAGIQFSDS